MVDFGRLINSDLISGPGNLVTQFVSGSVFTVGLGSGHPFFGYRVVFRFVGHFVEPGAPFISNPMYTSNSNDFASNLITSNSRHE